MEENVLSNYKNNLRNNFNFIKKRKTLSFSKNIRELRISV